MIKLSEEQIAERTFICKCGQRIWLTRVQINSRFLVELLPEQLRDKAQGMRERGEKPAVIAGSCLNPLCKETYGELISTGQEEPHFDFEDLKRNENTSGLRKVC